MFYESFDFSKPFISVMEQQFPLKNVDSCWNTKITFYLETSGGQNSTLLFNAVHFFNASVNLTSVAALGQLFY